MHKTDGLDRLKDEAMSKHEDARTGPVVIKKYANRRLYNTSTSSYVTLDHLCQMVKDDKDFVVYDAKTGDDITRAVLTQIIVEEESKNGQNLLPIRFLRQIISLYGDNMQWMVPRYLEHTMEAFAQNQERMRDYMNKSMGGMFPFNSIEDMSKQNMAMVEQAMRMFSPMGTPGGHQDPRQGQNTSHGDGRGSGPEVNPSNAGPRSEDEAIDELRERLDELQRQLATLKGARSSSSSDTGSDTKG